jgi:glycosyl transferase family 87
MRPDAYYLKALAMGIPALLLGLQLSGWIGFIRVIRDGHADFRNLYTAGYMLRTGHAKELYRHEAQKRFQDEAVSHEQIAIPFLRPAYQALLFAPFSWLSFRKAYLLLLVFNLGLLGISYRLLRAHTSHLRELWAGLPLGMFLFLPIGAALMQGQDSILLLAILSCALVALDGGREGMAGAIVALGLFKFQLVIPIALLFLLWRRWQFIAGFSIAGIALAGLSIGIAGWTQSEEYAASLLNLGASSSLSSGLPLPVDHMANLHGLVTGIFGRKSFARPLLLVGVVAMVVVAGVRRRSGGEALAIAVSVATVISHYLFIHDMSLLLIPIVWALDRLLRRELDSGDRIRTCIVAVMFTSPALMSFAPGSFYLVAIPGIVFAVMMATVRASGEHDFGETV